MRRHSRDSGPSMESDSFLDIVANIVGILIILIVIAGVRVGQSAALPVADSDPDPVSVAAAPSVPRPVPLVAPRPVIVVATPEPPPRRGPSPALIAAVAASEEQTARLRTEAAALDAEVGRLDLAVAEVAAARGTLTAQERTLADRATASDAAARRLAAELDALKAALAGVNRQITDTPQAGVTVLRHTLNPIGQEVEGKEIHFRLAGGRIARVPIEELIERLRPQIERQKDWIAKYHRHRGTVGPVQGFTMTYVVERQRAGLAEELRFGGATMRVIVTGWKVEPDPTLIAETAEVALRSGSRFVSALRLADRGTSLTFWVYPDSFDLYRKIEAAAHAEGFRVAARPLPDGVPISGSPQGSRSTSQ